MRAPGAPPSPPPSPGATGDGDVGGATHKAHDRILERLANRGLVLLHVAKLPPHLQGGVSFAVDPTNATTLYAVQHDCISRSYDEAATWSECWEAPGLNGSISGLEIKDSHTMLVLRGGSAPLRTTVKKDIACPQDGIRRESWHPCTYGLLCQEIQNTL